ncbi:hypothetical protein GCM10016455_05420 [Aliiroseovarius zhejiangensis]|uniref:Phage tail protein n=1 Tax=Aliiroseovarius zhejiangensis TaxID=1632025 RepID=A0ABQ3ISS9_9RHOB|nr:tail protein X [Aliiroseovarius zhejiangensis]GHE88209.1 hypothetical protein GCM10016455_05420 [Aliiroseovarius zhejiangensis]
MTAVSSRYRSKDGDVLDHLVRAHYDSDGDDVVAAVLDANPGLASIGPVLPVGIEILLPAYEPSEDRGTAQLWG